MKRLSLIVLAACLLLLAFAGCTGKTPEPKDTMETTTKAPVLDGERVALVEELLYSAPGLPCVPSDEARMLPQIKISPEKTPPMLVCEPADIPFNFQGILIQNNRTAFYPRTNNDALFIRIVNRLIELNHLMQNYSYNHGTNTGYFKIEQLLACTLERSYIHLVIYDVSGRSQARIEKSEAIVSEVLQILLDTNEAGAKQAYARLQADFFSGETMEIPVDDDNAITVLGGEAFYQTSAAYLLMNSYNKTDKESYIFYIDTANSLTFYEPPENRPTQSILMTASEHAYFAEITEKLSALYETVEIITMSVPEQAEINTTFTDTEGNEYPFNRKLFAAYYLSDGKSGSFYLTVKTDGICIFYYPVYGCFEQETTDNIFRFYTQFILPQAGSEKTAEEALALLTEAYALNRGYFIDPLRASSDEINIEKFEALAQRYAHTDIGVVLNFDYRKVYNEEVNMMSNLFILGDFTYFRYPWR